MQVFKCAMRIIRRNMVYLLVYVVGLSFMGVGIASATTVPSPGEFERVQLNYAVIDRDGSDVSEAIGEFLSLYGERVELADDPGAMQDAVAKNSVEYVLVIPNGYGDAFERAARNGDELPRMEVTYSYLEASGTFFDESVDNCLGMLATRLYASPDMDVSDAAGGVVRDAADQVQVEVLPSSTTAAQSRRFCVYLQFSSYALFASVVACVGVVISTMRRTDVRRRQSCAPVSSLANNVQTALASLMVVLFACLWTLLLGLVVFWESAMAAGAASVALMGLSLFVFALVPLGIAFFIGTLGASSAMSNAIGNITGLVISFLGGVWVPLDITGDFVRTIAMFLPGVWFTSSLDVAANGVKGIDTLAPYVADLAVLVLYAVLFLLLGLLAGRLRQRPSS